MRVLIDGGERRRSSEGGGGRQRRRREEEGKREGGRGWMGREGRKKGITKPHDNKDLSPNTGVRKMRLTPVLLLAAVTVTIFATTQVRTQR